jgi:hypothetical protein
MRIDLNLIVGSILAAAVTSGAWAQSAKPASPMASAPAPMTAASKQVPTRNAAVMAAENAKEPGNQRPEERVISQIRWPLQSRSSAAAAASLAPSAAGHVPGGVDDGAARCLATGSASEKAACERGLNASEPMKSKR